MREENENLSDLMFDDCRSCSESTSTSDSYHEIRNKWHSAEDIRNRRSGKKHNESKCNIRKQHLAHTKYSGHDQDVESTKSDRNSDIDNEKAVVENRHAKKVSSI